MLIESSQVTQERNTDIRRRWFVDDGMDLIVWYRTDGSAEGFQLCYDAEDGREQALTWRAAHGFSHARVDSGDTRPDKNMTPILVRGGAVPWARVKAEFDQRASQLEPAVRSLVHDAFATREN